MNEEQKHLMQSYYELHEKYYKLQQENKQLKDKIEKLKDYGEAVGEKRNQLYDKIDKAIEYIKENACYEDDIKECNSDLVYSDCTELLEILGDKQ